MCHVVKIVNLLGEFCLVYRLSNEVSEYILELVNKFAIMPAFQAIVLPRLHKTLAVCANFEIAA